MPLELASFGGIMEEQKLPKRLKLEYRGEIRNGFPGEYWMDSAGLLHPIIYAETEREWPIYRVVEEQS